MAIYGLLVFIFGTILGSFFNVVIYRLPKKESIVIEPSHCTQCGQKIKPYDLIPILSYGLLKGRCRHCGAKISIRYPLVELLTGLSFLLVYLRFGFQFEFFIGLILTSILIIITMIDIDTMEINDRFQIMILMLAIITIFTQDVNILEHLIGFFIISVPFFIIALITEGLGGGDIKLVAIAGLLLGYKRIFVAFLIAALIGGVYAIYLLTLKGQSQKKAIAFGPYLCIGIYLGYLYGYQILEWYLSLFT